MFSSFWAKLSYNKLFLIISEILGVLNNTLTSKYQCSRSNRENIQLAIQIKLSKNGKYFALFFLNF